LTLKVAGPLDQDSSRAESADAGMELRREQI